MIANNIEPFHLTHPIEIIKDGVEFRGISLPVRQLNEVLNTKWALNTEFALQIGHAASSGSVIRWE